MRKTLVNTVKKFKGEIPLLDVCVREMKKQGYGRELGGSMGIETSSQLENPDLLYKYLKSEVVKVIEVHAGKGKGLEAEDLVLEDVFLEFLESTCGSEMSFLYTTSLLQRVQCLAYNGVSDSESLENPLKRRKGDGNDKDRNSLTTKISLHDSQLVEQCVVRLLQEIELYAMRSHEDDHVHRAKESGLHERANLVLSILVKEFNNDISSLSPNIRSAFRELRSIYISGTVTPTQISALYELMFG